jgi:hypothetical protein
MRKLLLAALMLVPHLAFAQVRIVGGIRVNVPPPALRVEVQPVAPSGRHVWIAGYWGWRGAAHVWNPGHWVVPPSPAYSWEPAHWQDVGGHWMFYEGHWRSTEQPAPQIVYQPPPPPVTQVVVAAQPPAPVEEIRTAPPFEGATWIPGYWHWNGGQHVWIAGRWSARPAGYDWDRDRWENHEGRWRFHHGHWKHHGHDEDHDD